MNGIRQIEVILDSMLVGRLALTKDGLCAFMKNEGYLCYSVINNAAG